MVAGGHRGVQIWWRFLNISKKLKWLGKVRYSHSGCLLFSKGTMRVKRNCVLPQGTILFVKYFFYKKTRFKPSQCLILGCGNGTSLGDEADSFELCEDDDICRRRREDGGGGEGGVLERKGNNDWARERCEVAAGVKDEGEVTLEQEYFD